LKLLEANNLLVVYRKAVEKYIFFAISYFKPNQKKDVATIGVIEKQVLNYLFFLDSSR